MNRMIYCSLFIVMVACAALCLLWEQTSEILLTTNEKLANDLAAKDRVVRNAELTVWKEVDGSLTIVVNGQFEHIYPHICLVKPDVF